MQRGVSQQRKWTDHSGHGAQFNIRDQRRALDREPPCFASAGISSSAAGRPDSAYPADLRELQPPQQHYLPRGESVRSRRLCAGIVPARWVCVRGALSEVHRAPV